MQLFRFDKSSHQVNYTNLIHRWLSLNNTDVNTENEIISFISLCLRTVSELSECSRSDPDDPESNNLTDGVNSKVFAKEKADKILSAIHFATSELYCQGRIKFSNQAAKFHLELAASQGHLEAQIILGINYEIFRPSARWFKMKRFPRNLTLFVRGLLSQDCWVSTHGSTALRRKPSDS